MGNVNNVYDTIDKLKTKIINQTALLILTGILLSLFIALFIDSQLFLVLGIIFFIIIFISFCINIYHDYRYIKYIEGIIRVAKYLDIKLALSETIIHSVLFEYNGYKPLRITLSTEEKSDGSLPFVDKRIKDFIIKLGRGAPYKKI